ncbi:MAG: LPS assembly lipoprotein LptE [Sulfuricaulis sp.]|nr:LPS assembly lipoprotein LptE [Sulfuricaulis sp.]
MASSQRPVASNRSRSALLLLLVMCNLLLVSCGFHLRGAGTVELSPRLSSLRVNVEGNQLQNDPLLAAMKNVLRTQADVQIEDSGDAPLLVLYGEHSDSQVLSVSSTGKADEYLLKYEVSFRLIDKDNRLLSESQTVRIQRDHAFDRLNVLSKEREEQELRREMQRDAVQQILRRLSRITIQEIKTMEPQINTDQNR